ncbi:MAG: NAD-dependent deacetylase [Kiritimatiellae bacterium]|nr:NAD-dependent deacetylase [Kiritimatiellia bacterium]
MKTLLDAIRDAKCVAAMTGAGVSTLCGIPDFRGPNGLYKKPDAERIFDIDWFDRDPSIYYNGCRDLVYALADFQPGPVHRALKRLEDAGKLDGIITQNIDMLHQKAGSANVQEVHGSPMLHHCRRCGGEKSFDDIVALVAANGGLERLGDPFVPRCQCGGAYKPDITFFGESLPERAFENARRLAARADVMLVLGTSLTVFPAAHLPRITLQHGGRLFIVNAQPTPLDGYASGLYPDLAAFAEAVIRSPDFGAPRPGAAL